MDSQRDAAAKMMPHILAMNSNPTVCLKNNRQPPPAVSNVTAFAKGGKVQKYAKGGKVMKHDDAKQDKKQIKSMVKPSCIKKATGGKVQKLAAGGVAKLRKGSPTPKPIKKVSLQGG